MRIAQKVSQDRLDLIVINQSVKRVTIGGEKRMRTTSTLQKTMWLVSSSAASQMKRRKIRRGYRGCEIE